MNFQLNICFNKGKDWEIKRIMMLNKKIIISGGIIALFACLYSVPAFADIDDVSGEGNMLGDMMIAFKNGVSSLPNLIAFLAYLTGVLFAALGIYKLKNHVELGPQTVQLAEPLKFLFAGGLMLALPSIAGVAQATFGGVGDGIDVGGGSGSWAIGGASSGGGLDGMLIGFMQSIYRPTQILMEFFCYVAGAALTLIAVHRFTKTAQEGARGPTGLGTISTFVLAGVLFSIGPSIGTFTDTLFGTRESAIEVSFMALEGGAGDLTQARNVLTSILAFMIIVGILSMIRGFFVLRGVAEGDQQMTMMSGVSHVIAGAILVNFGQFANIIQNTLGITEYGVLFN